MFYSTFNTYLIGKTLLNFKLTLSFVVLKRKREGKKGGKKERREERRKERNKQDQFKTGFKIAVRTGFKPVYCF